MTPKSDSSALEMQAWRTRIGLNKRKMADYLGISYNTYDKWEIGTRKPPAVARRLFEVLQIVETFSPALAQQWQKKPQG